MTASDLAEFLNGRAQTTAAKCPVSRLVDSVRAEDESIADQLESLIASDFPNTRLHANLRKAGYAIGRSTLSDHRRALCVCKE
jgi:hypothetical protein